MSARPSSRTTVSRSNVPFSARGALRSTVCAVSTTLALAGLSVVSGGSAPVRPSAFAYDAELDAVVDRLLGAVGHADHLHGIDEMAVLGTLDGLAVDETQ